MPPPWSGVDTTAYKIAAYVLSAVFCAAAGAAYASWTGYIDPTESFQILMTVKVPVMAMLGGAGTVAGPRAGAAAFVLLEEVFWANFIDWNRAILGIVIVLLIFFLPGGLLSIGLLRWRRAAVPSSRRQSHERGTDPQARGPRRRISAASKP